MKRRRVRIRRKWLVPLALLLLPPLFWAVVLAITPTEWARSRIVARLSAATGRPIHLGALNIGVLGGVRLADLAIGAPGADADPWLKVASARINVSVLQLLAGQVDPTEIDVRGLTLRVLRRADGSLELADLLRPEPAGESRPSGSSPECAGPSALQVRLRDAHVTVVDEPSGTRLELTGVEGRATWQGRQAAIHDLHGTLNGGPFELAASLDRASGEPAFEGRVQARGVALDQQADALAYLVPVLSGATDGGSVDGRLDASLYVKGQGANCAALQRSLVGRGAICLDPITLDGSRFLAEVDRLIDLPEQARVGSVKSDFVIKDGRIATDNLTLDVSRVPIVLAGWTDFDGRLDYRVRAEALTDRLPDRARGLLADLAIDTNQLSALRLRGTLDAMTVSLDAGSLGALTGHRPGDPAPSADDRQKLRDLGRRFRDRILR